MDTDEELAPAVASILAAARERGGAERGGATGESSDSSDGNGDRLSVTDAASLPDALAAAEADGRVPVIAEVKPTSPTTDGERTDDPVELAEQMVAGGAAALSVLTEPEHFGGSAETLERVRDAVDVPVLRKDFLLQESQLDVVESDLVLLIARFLGDDLGPMLEAARGRGFGVLVEVHTEAELAAAVAAGADVIGVNNRDLGKLEVDLSTFEEVGAKAPEDATLIAESGIASREDAARMRRAGADGLLVGSAIMAGDVRANTERLTTPMDTQTETTE